MAATVMNLEKVTTNRHCCVPLCNGDGRIHTDLSFHRFPLTEPLKTKWIHAIRRDPGPMFQIGAQTVVCSRHFTKEDYKWTPVRKTLKSDSIPSVFNWTKEVTPRRQIFKYPLPSKRKLFEENYVESLDSNETMCSQGLQLQADWNLGVFDEIPSADTAIRIKELEERLKEKEEEVKRLQEEKEEEVNRLQAKFEMEKFGVNRFMYDDSMIQFYTGFVSVSMFTTFFNFVQPAASTMTSHYYKSADNTLTFCKQRSMLLIDELFMFLCRLKCGLLEQDLAVRFNCHISTVSRKIITWANFMYFVLGSFNIWPSRCQIQAKMPEEFKLMYPNTRVVIDCTEIKTERPSSLALGSKCYSSYKSSHTWKGLVGIAPHGAVTFISSLYTGSMSDVEMTKLCGLVDLLESGDSIMADKGFVLNKVLEGTGITVNTPPFLMSQGQFTKWQVEETQVIAKLRIHVERHIRRVKEYHLFDKIVPLSMLGTINQLWTVANVLTLFRGPIVKEWV